MNAFSWLIYAADRANGVSFLFGLLGLLAAALCLLLTIFKHVGAQDWKGLTKPWLLALTAFLWFISAAIPSRDAFYLIAGSEVGQRIVESPGTQEILGDVKDIITKELKRIKEAK